MAIHPFTLDYSDVQKIKSLQVEAIETVRKSSIITKTDNKKKEKRKSFSKDKQNRLGKELKIIFNELELEFIYTIGQNNINLKIYDKNNKFILEDNLEDLEDILNSMKKEKGKILDLKI